MSRPKISILTATFNALEGLRLTRESIVGQTFDDYEHIVIDGGSSDATKEWLETQSDVIVWLSEPDEGIADALNKGLKLATGEWVLVLHAEDVFEGSASLSQAAGHLESDVDIVSFDVHFILGNSWRRYRSKGFSPGINFKTTIPHQGALCRRELFEAIGEFNTSLRIALDYEFFLRAYRRQKRALVVPLFLSRMPATGLSSRMDWASLRERFAEERAVHLMHCPSVAMRLVYEVYWPAYLAYRRVRHLLVPQVWATHSDAE